MALVSLKHVFFGKPPVQSGTGSTASDDTFASDPERQPLMTSPKPQTYQLHDGSHSAVSSRGFRVDARVISDATIGLSDGLTVPFALTAGLSALGKTEVVIYGGLAELIAGAISMGLGGYLGAKSEFASYQETRRECVELAESHEPCAQEAIDGSVRSVFGPFDLPPHLLSELSQHLSRSPARQVDFLMRFEHCAPEPASNRAAVSGLTIAAGYLLGGLLPLAPYFFVGHEQVELALWISVAVMVAALFAFGYAKTCAVSGWAGRERVWQGVKGGAEMVIVGGAAAAAAMGLVRLFDCIAGGGDA